MTKLELLILSSFIILSLSLQIKVGLFIVVFWVADELQMQLFANVRLYFSTSMGNLKVFKFLKQGKWGVVGNLIKLSFHCHQVFLYHRLLWRVMAINVCALWTCQFIIVKICTFGWNLFYTQNGASHSFLKISWHQSCFVSTQNEVYLTSFPIIYGSHDLRIVWVVPQKKRKDCLGFDYINFGIC